MKPDLGFQLIRSGVSEDTTLTFYGVPFYIVDFLAPSSYSSVVEHHYLGSYYAASFDFGDDVLAFLVSNIPAQCRESFANAIIGKVFPFSAELPLCIEANALECRLGKLQRGAHDSFVPLIVTAIT